MNSTTFDKSQAMALKLGDAAQVLFCTFDVSKKDGRLIKKPIQRGGKAGVPAVISDDALFTASDVYGMEAIQHGQYFGLNMNKPHFVEGKGYLVCLDVDMKHKPNSDTTHQAILRLRNWVVEKNVLTEKSLSGVGRHVFLFAKTANNILRNYPLAEGQEVEIFGLASSDKKSILLTGDSMDGEVIEVNDLEKLLTELGIAEESPTQRQRGNSKPFHEPLPLLAKQPVSDSQEGYLKALQALKFISPDTLYDRWIKVGQALHDGFGEQGYFLWDKWSSLGAKYKGQADIDTHWKSFHQAGGVGIGTLFHFAKENGYKNYATGADFSDLIIENETRELLPPGLAPVSVSDVISNPSPAPAFVWDGYLPRGVVSMLGAHGGTGKSTVALMLCVAAALGRQLFGVNTVQCKTLFVSLEDSALVVRHRLANICQKWFIDPTELEGKLTIVDGTEQPELFSADYRNAGSTTRTYREMSNLIKTGDIGLVVVDNASDAYGGDEIQRRQVRAFIRSLMEVIKPVNCALLLLAHVDKNTSRQGRADGGEAYSGSTAWHNSVRSRLFMARENSGLLTIAHQKSNLGRCRDSVSLQWLDGQLPELAGMGVIYDPLNPQLARQAGQVDDDRAIVLLRMIFEFESRGHFCSSAATSRNHTHAVLKTEPDFLKLRLRPDDTKRLLNQCQRAKWIEIIDYRDFRRKPHQRWSVTDSGRMFAGLSAPTAPTSGDGTR